MQSGVEIQKMKKSFDEQYIDLAKNILENGEESGNRTGVNTLFKIGHEFVLDCSDSFPLLTTKRVFWKTAFAEMLGFIRGYTDASDFRKIGCSVWDKDANENQDWLKSGFRLGKDDCGRIYGKNWRQWYVGRNSLYIDQLQMVVDDLSKRIDNRREIVTAWNPGEMEFFDYSHNRIEPSMMSLPPCHMTMVFSLVNQKTTLDLFVLQRSWDLFLGNPFNIAQYAFLLHLIAHLTGLKVGTLRYYGVNVHIYIPHIPLLNEQISRNPKEQKPQIAFKYLPRSLSDLEKEPFDKISDWVEILNYDPHPAIKGEMYTTQEIKNA
jgi:thymidylate synthase